MRSMMHLMRSTMLAVRSSVAGTMHRTGLFIGFRFYSVCAAGAVEAIYPDIGKNSGRPHHKHNGTAVSALGELTPSSSNAV